jgi:hypothetical protein
VRTAGGATQAKNLEVTQLVYKSPKTKEGSVECDRAGETDECQGRVRRDGGSSLLYDIQHSSITVGDGARDLFFACLEFSKQLPERPESLDSFPDPCHRIECHATAKH